MRSAPPLWSRHTPTIEAIAISTPRLVQELPNLLASFAPRFSSARALASAAGRFCASTDCSMFERGVSAETTMAAPNSAMNACSRRNTMPPTTMTTPMSRR